MTPPQAGPLIPWTKRLRAQQELIQATGHCALERARRYVHQVHYPNGTSRWVCIQCGNSQIKMIADIPPEALAERGSPAVSVRDYPKSALDWSRCHYCGQKFDWETDKLNPTRDHIVPRSLGGVDALVNLVASCRGCNEKKSDRWPTCSCQKCSAAIQIHRLRAATAASDT